MAGAFALVTLSDGLAVHGEGVRFDAFLVGGRHQLFKVGCAV